MEKVGDRFKFNLSKTNNLRDYGFNDGQVIEILEIDEDEWAFKIDADIVKCKDHTTDLIGTVLFHQLVYLGELEKI